MSDRTTILGSGSMLLADIAGDVAEGEGPGGLYLADTRHVSAWNLELVGPDGRIRPLRVAGERRTSSAARVALVPPTARNVAADLLLVREQEVGASGLTERVVVHNTSRFRATGTLRLCVCADFIDQFLVRAEPRPFERGDVTRGARAIPSGVEFTYVHDHPVARIERTTQVVATPAPVVVASKDTGGGRGGRAVMRWELDIAPGQSTEVHLTVTAGAAVPAPVEAATVPTVPSPAVPPVAPGSGALDPPPSSIDDPPVDPARLARTALADIDALTMACPTLPGFRIPAAGVPWFLTLFGRDSLLTSLLVRPERPALLPGVIGALAATQADTTDPRRVAEPGKILHELRVCELSTLDVVPYARYYGSVDATALFLIGLGALDEAEIRRLGADGLEAAARAAVAWLRGPGGLDEFGVVRYTPDPGGLVNQGWKDSADAVAFADGTLATGPIALVEVQGYVWRALRDTARLARTSWNDPGWADELDEVADRVRAVVARRYWLPGQDFPALALDGAGAPVDSLTSNAGHLLWSGILAPDEARAVADRLISPEFFTGWGLRTLAAGQVPYAPLSYHNGSVWPHDTALAAAGMAAYGLDRHARLLADGLLAAAANFDGRLPELFAGVSRQEFDVPVRYAHAATPQAWAAAATVTAARLADPLATATPEESPEVTR